MVADFTRRTYGVNQAFRYVEGIWLHRKSRQIKKLFRKRRILHHMCATCPELPSYISTINKIAPLLCPTKPPCKISHKRVMPR